MKTFRTKNGVKSEVTIYSTSYDIMHIRNEMTEIILNRYPDNEKEEQAISNIIEANKLLFKALNLLNH